jgi:soluble lytic murein transglycosylase
MKRARAYALAGDHNAALALYNELIARTTNDNTRSLIQLRKGQSFTALGQPAEATAAYLEAVNNYPTAYESYLALLEVVESGASVNELNRGLVDYYAGEYGVALAAFHRYLQNSPADPGTALFFSGMTNRTLGETTRALDEWNELIQNYPEHLYWDRAWEEKAYTQWYFMEQYPEAVQTLLDFTEQNPSHARAAEFLFDAALVAERSGELGQAAELWERVINLYPGHEQASRALFLSGIARYRQQDYSGAFLAFERLLGLASEPGSRSMAHFWIGKTQQKLGDENQARASWEQAANADPTGYYSERALDLLYGKQPFSPPLAFDLSYDYASERANAEAWLRSIFLLPDNADLSGVGGLVYNPLFVRGNELWELGLYEEARTEFEELRLSLRSDPVGSFLLADHLAKIGLYRSATLAAREVLNLAGMDDAETMNAPLFFNRLRFGTYFKELIIPTAQKYDFHPLFIFSLIRQESLFESFVRSSAAASGLMQIIPTTGKEISKNLGWPPDYSDKDLTRPFVNVQLGLEYLNTQREAFDGDLYAALAAYNGGPGNASQWLKLANGDQDLFLETIRYAETRDYLRRIYEIFNIYRRLYSRSP